MFQQTLNAIVRRGCIIFLLLPFNQQLSWYVCHSSHAKAFHNLLCHTRKCFLPSCSIWNLSENDYSNGYLFYGYNNLSSENIPWLAQTMQVLSKCLCGIVPIPHSLSSQLHSHNTRAGKASSRKASPPPICCWVLEAGKLPELKAY